MGKEERRWCQEQGFTLVELLVAATVSIVLLLATMSLMDVAFKDNAKISQQTSAAQTARTAIEDVIRHLRSQVCLNASTPPVVAASDNSVTFYSDLSNGSQPPTETTYIVNTAARTLTEQTYQGIAGNPVTFPGQPTQTRIFYNVTTNGAAPIFQYYSFNSATPPAATNLLATPVTGPNLSLIAMIAVQLQAWPAGSTTNANANTVQDQAYVRLANPNASAPVPTCS